MHSTPPVLEPVPVVVPVSVAVVVPVVEVVEVPVGASVVPVSLTVPLLVGPLAVPDVDDEIAPLLSCVELLLPLLPPLLLLTSVSVAMLSSVQPAIVDRSVRTGKIERMRPMPQTRRQFGRGSTPNADPQDRAGVPERMREPQRPGACAAQWSWS